MVFDGSEARIDGRGNLIVHFPYDNHTKFKITPWSRGLECSIWEDGEWCSANHKMMMPILVSDEPADSVHARFIESIPKEVREAISPMKHLQFKLLRWTANDERIYDLVISFPLLAMVLVDDISRNREKWKGVDVDALLNEKQRDLFEVMFGWSSKAALKALKKVVIERVSDKEMKAIRYMLIEPERVMCHRHQSVIPIHQLVLLRKFPDIENYKYAQEYFHPAYTATVSAAVAGIISTKELIRDTERMARQMERFEEIDRKLRSAANRGKIQELHDELTDLYNRQSREINRAQFEKRHGKFPAPPLEGTEFIEPITSYDALMDEGQKMRHCVGSYASSVAQGKCYIYRVMQPQRATVEVSLRKDRVTITQMKLERNREPSKECWMAVEEWLAHD